ncbi:MAG: prolyl oligopeptidase family serine peptidase [Hydrogenophaga sp.]|nr:prolyl oligopeptidase family serine peptidase [Hydrogenophaga sp.]
MSITRWMARTASSVFGLALVMGLTACAVSPQHTALKAADGAGQLAPLLPVRAFVANVERTGGFVMSPDGERLLWSQTVGLDAGLAVRRVAADASVTAYAVGNQGRGGGYYNWLPDSRHFVFSKDEQGDENIRLFVQDADSAGLAPWSLSPVRGVRSFVVGMGPEGSARFFLASNQRDKRSFDLYEADVGTRTLREVARNDGLVLHWLIDTQGQFAGRVRQLAHADGSDSVVELRQTDDQWRVLQTVGGFDSFWVQRIDPVARRAWALSNLGRDKTALVELNLDGGEQRVLADHARVDLSQVLFDGRHGAPVGYVVEPGYPEVWYLNPAGGQAAQTVVAQALGEGQLPAPPVMIRRSGGSADGRRTVWRSQSDFDYAELLWDRQTGAVKRLNTQFKELAQTLSPTVPFEFKASDGRAIAGYLVRPRGVKGPVPMVVEIHGGPWARDHWLPATYHPRQLLANRGYAVLQVNYRGSSGYGRDHMWAAERQTNGRLQKDIAEAVQWAVAQGVADPQRLAVLGGSFGGFSVLAQLAQKPHDYRCGVNVVGAANWPRLIESWPAFWRNRHYFARTFGDVSIPAERAEMLRNSPVSYLDQIQAPLLVIHGANDIRVLRQDSDDVVTALRQRGHPVQYLLFDNEGHSISKWRNRLAMWREIEDFFAGCLGGRSAGFDYYQLMPR